MPVPPPLDARVTEGSSGSTNLLSWPDYSSHFSMFENAEVEADVEAMESTVRSSRAFPSSTGSSEGTTQLPQECPWQLGRQRPPKLAKPAKSGKIGKSVGGAASNASNLRRNKWINRQLMKTADASNLPKLLQTVEFHIHEMNSINLTTALHRLTKLAVAGNTGMNVTQLSQNPSFQQLRRTIASLIERHQKDRKIEQGNLHEAFEVQCMSIVCWSCATLRLREDALMATIGSVVLERLDELKPFELSNMVWAYAKLSTGSPAFYQAVSDRMFWRKPGAFGLQCLSMIAWSFATAKQKDTSLFLGIAWEISLSATLTKPQEVANTTWAYAKNRCLDTKMFNVLADTMLDNNLLWSFKAQELSNTLWAFATISLHHDRLFDAAVPIAISKRFTLSPQNIANILWAYAKLQTRQRAVLFQALLGVSVGMMPRHKPKEISAIAWAAAKENSPACKNFFGATARMCAQRLHEFSPQALANMVEAFAVVEEDRSFADAMKYESVNRLHQFEPTALANLFRGAVLFARRAKAKNQTARDYQLLESIGAHIATRLDNMQTSDRLHIEHSMQLLGPQLKYRTGGLNKVALRKFLGAGDPSQPLGSSAEITSGDEGLLMAYETPMHDDLPYPSHELPDPDADDECEYTGDDDLYDDVEIGAPRRPCASAGHTLRYWHCQHSNCSTFTSTATIFRNWSSHNPLVQQCC
jgi:hypothetical protein